MRVHRGPDDHLAIGSGPGRGAWLCGAPDTLACFDEAAKRRALDRALRTPVGRNEVVALRAKLEDMSG